MKPKKEKVGKKASESSADGIKGTIKGFIEEVENTSVSLASEVKQHFDDLTERVSDVVGNAAETTVSMAEKVTVKDPAELIKGLLDEIKHASEVSIQVIGDRFEELRHNVLSTDEKKPRKKAAKKRGAKKKTVKKKTAKKVASKKKAAKKKVVRKAVAKKAVAKKKAAKTKVSKKAGAKKTVSKKKTATKKKTTAKKRAMAGR